MKRSFTGFNSKLAPWIVLGFSLAITFLLWRTGEKTIEQAVEARFQLEIRSIEDSIVERLKMYELMLQGCLGLFNASDFVDRREWKMYVKALDPDNNYPGIQGIGFSLRVPAAEKAAHVRQLRAEGFPDYTIRPAGERSEYFPIIYLEPFSDRNLRAFSYDMFSEPVRRAAMEKARDTGVAAMSGKVRLVQETARNVQPGFLIYLPLYEKNLPLDTQEDRRAALRGFVYSPFRMDDFINGIITWDTAAVQWEVYDGTGYGADALLYRSSAAAPDTSDEIRARQKKTSFALFNRTWSLYFRALPALTASIDRTNLRFMVCSSLVISLLLFSITFLIVARAKALARDMDRQKAAAEELRQTSDYLESLIDYASAPIITWDRAYRITRFNHAFENLTGYGAEEVYGRELAMLFPQESLDESLEKIARTSGGERWVSVEIPILRKDGVIRTVLWNSANIYSHGHTKLVATIAQGVDITDRKSAEEALMAKNDELIRFNYTVSHDLKSPLVTIKTFLGYLEHDLAKADSEKMAKDLTYIHTAADKMNALLEDLLDLSRIGSVANVPGEVMLEEIVKEALQLAAGTISRSGVRVVVAEKPQVLYGDRARLVQVFQNLIENAVKFMGPQAEPKVEIGAEQANGTVLCFVRDNGMGIDPRHQSKLFGLFQKLDENAEGTGIGLALVKRIIETHGGRIRVESEGPGKGACFWFTLPIKEVEG